MSRFARLPFFTVDAFATRPFAGNGAAIVLLPSRKWPSDRALQSFAAEVNLSETAYILPPKDAASPESDEEALAMDIARVKALFAGAGYGAGASVPLRWFTPTNEVALCGHATLATAAALRLGVGASAAAFTFETLSGELVASSEVPSKTDEKQDSSAASFSLSLPANPPRDSVDPVLSDVDRVLSCLFGEGESRKAVQTVSLSRSAKKLLVLLRDGNSENESEKLLLSLSPHFSALQSCHDGSVFKGVIVTTRASPHDSVDFLSRYFAPWNGINEDPVTGSAHTVLSPFWSERLSSASLRGRQCSKRGGEVSVKDESAESGRVLVGGPALLIINGTAPVELSYDE